MNDKVEFIESYIKRGGDYQWCDNHGELVRCKDCKYWSEFHGNMICKAVCADPYETWFSKENDYCSLGERKETKEENGQAD